MISNERTLSEADLGLVSGGIWDRPERDRANKMIADQNRTGLGASIGNVIPGIVVQGSGPGTPGHPFGTNT